MSGMTDAEIARDLTVEYHLAPPLCTVCVAEVRENMGDRALWGIQKYGDELAASIEAAILRAAGR